jgi:hypothetical protein
MASATRAGAALTAILLGAASHAAAAPRPHARSAVIFVADGLRPGSIDAARAPALTKLRGTGVWFANSHAMYPTLTTPNASAIATGHMLGDTGDFGNVLFAGFPSFDRAGAGGPGPGSVTPFIEDDQVLADLNAHFAGGSFLGETTLLALARARGFNTAVVGKVGPVAIQDVTQAGGRGKRVPVPRTIIVDDRTGDPAGIPLPPAVRAAMEEAHLPSRAPPKDTPPAMGPGAGAAGGATARTGAPSFAQQRYFSDVVTKVILPAFARDKKPFVLVVWSREPDSTQHTSGDGADLRPGINGPTSALAVARADTTLSEVAGFIAADPALAAGTDLFVTSDHGFSTLSRRDLDAQGVGSTCGAARRTYRDLAGNSELAAGSLPAGFVAIDLATELGLPLYDPDTQIETAPGKKSYARVDCACDRPTGSILQRPKLGNGLIGGTGAIRPPNDAKLVVAANGGSDLIYAPGGDQEVVARAAAFLLKQDYIDGVFVDDRGGEVPGALPLGAINLKGKARTPTPAIVVALKTFCLDPDDPLGSAVEISDTVLPHGQGMHGSFGRADTMNTMIAFGPDFKRGFVDRAPAGNADVAVTVAKLLGLAAPGRGKLRGRVLSEALVGGPEHTPSTCGVAASTPGPLGLRTWLHFQEAAGVRYLDAAKKTAGDVSWDSWADELPCAPPTTR